MPVSCSPWMGAVVGGAASTPQSLYSLLVALAAAKQPTKNDSAPSPILHCAAIQIQADPNGGATLYYIGTSAMSATDCGLALVAGQPWQPPSLEFNGYDLRTIYLMADGSSARWLVTFVRK